MAKKGTGLSVAAFVLLGIIALAFLALKTAALPSLSAANTYSLRARFNNIGALKVNAAVRCAGVPVGRVTSITLDKEAHQGLVIMTINDGQPFPIDSSAKVLTAGLLGDQYVGIEAGSDGQNMANGDLIRRTQSAMVLETLIDQLVSSKTADPRAKSKSTVDAYVSSPARAAASR